MNSISIVWALNTLQNLGYIIQNPEPQIILQTPWSQIYRFITHRGYCYLKQVPSGLSLEPQVIHFLQENYGASVPILIASNPQSHCFLMQDAGIPLREFFLKQEFNAKLLTAVIHDYITLQRKSVIHVDRLLSLGLSDWRLQKIPDRYITLLQQETLLISDGLKKYELKKLSKLTSKLVEICEQLSQYALPDTFSQNDFHDNNLLIDLKTEKITMVDLGEVAITHPFFSLLNMLHQLQKHFQLPHVASQHLEQQVLQPWSDYGSQTQLLAAMSLIQQCWSVHRALTVYRCLTSIETTSAQELLGHSNSRSILTN